MKTERITLSRLLSGRYVLMLDLPGIRVQSLELTPVQGQNLMARFKDVVLGEFIQKQGLGSLNDAAKRKGRQ